MPGLLPLTSGAPRRLVGAAVTGPQLSSTVYESRSTWFSAFQAPAYAMGEPEGCTNSVPSCRRLIVFVQQAAESISPTYPCINGKRRPRELFLLRCLELQRTVRSLAVVMMNVDREDVLKVGSGEDEQPVQALRPHGSVKGAFIRLPRLSCSFAQRQYVVAAIT